MSFASLDDDEVLSDAVIIEDQRRQIERLQQENEELRRKLETARQITREYVQPQLDRENAPEDRPAREALVAMNDVDLATALYDPRLDEPIPYALTERRHEPR